MTDLNQNLDQAKDMLNLEQKDMQKLPQMLNVLTILTYIGCALGAISAIWNYMSASTAYKLYQSAGGLDTLKTENKELNSMLSGANEMVKKAYDLP
jgi:hypothetical protein